MQPLVLTTAGQFQSILAAANIEVLGCRGVSQFDNTRYGYYRGLRWLVLLREIFYLPSTLSGLLAARRKWGRVDIVHINELTLAPVIWLAKRLFSCPIVVHVRSVQRPLSGLRGKLLRKLFLNNTDCLIAIDNTVKRSLDEQLRSVVIHNGLRVVRREPHSLPAQADKVFTVGMVGGLSQAKGCLEFIEAARICRERGANIRFVFVGQSMRQPVRLIDSVLRFLGLSQEIYEEMQSRILTLSLQEMVEFWPFTTALDEVYGKLDLICFPSHFDAPGRPIFEAGLFGLPSVAAISSPTNDTIVDGVTGLTVPPRNPEALADAIISLYENPQKRRDMGRNALSLALANFDVHKNAAAVLAVYRELLSGCTAEHKQQ